MCYLIRQYDALTRKAIISRYRHLSVGINKQLSLGMNNYYYA